MNKEVIIIGAGGQGRVLADIVNESGDIVYGFLDDNAQSDKNVNIVGRVEDCEKYRDKFFIVGIGNNKLRQRIVNQYHFLNFYTAIHPSAVISRNALIGEGTCVMANAVINTDAEVGKHCIINTHTTIEHDDTVGDFVHVSPGATLCGTVTVGDCVHIGAGATVKNNVRITSESIIGMGAVVLRNIDTKGTYIGIPATIMEK